MFNAYEQFYVPVSCIYQDMQKIRRAVISGYGLRGPQAQYLIALSHYPQGITAARLCQIYEKDKAAISRTVAELEQMGLVKRTLTGGSRYRASLSLTQKGSDIAKAVNQTAQLAVDQAGAGLDEEKRQVFYEVLGLISENLHAICEGGLKEMK